MKANLEVNEMGAKDYISLMLELATAIIRNENPAFKLKCHWVKLVSRFPDLGCYNFPSVSASMRFNSEFVEVIHFLKLVSVELGKKK